MSQPSFLIILHPCGDIILLLREKYVPIRSVTQLLLREKYVYSLHDLVGLGHFNSHPDG